MNFEDKGLMCNIPQPFVEFALPTSKTHYLLDVASGNIWSSGTRDRLMFTAFSATGGIHEPSDRRKYRLGNTSCTIRQVVNNHQRVWEFSKESLNNLGIVYIPTLLEKNAEAYIAKKYGHGPITALLNDSSNFPIIDVNTFIQNNEPFARRCLVAKYKDIVYSVFRLRSVGSTFELVIKKDIFGEYTMRCVVANPRALFCKGVDPVVADLRVSTNKPVAFDFDESAFVFKL